MPKSDEYQSSPFGCGFLILCGGAVAALLIWANSGFPKFWQ